jgi:hypothetical protein
MTTVIERGQSAIGRKKAKVLPQPQGAIKTQSRFASILNKTSSCSSFGGHPKTCWQMLMALNRKARRRALKKERGGGGTRKQKKEAAGVNSMLRLINVMRQMASKFVEILLHLRR